MARWLIRYRYLTAGLSLSVLAALTVYVPTLQFDASLQVWFLQDDPDLVSYRAFNDRFGSDEVLLIAMPGTDPFSVEEMTRTARLTAVLETIENVARVRSLTNTDVVLDEGGVANVGPLVEELPTTAEESEAIRAAALGAETIRGTLISGDGTTGAILVELVHIPGEEDYKYEVVRRVRETLATEGITGAQVAGTPIVDDAFFRYTQSDFQRFILPLLLVIVIASMVLLRRPWALGAILAVVITATLFVFGLMGALGVKINIASTILGPLMAAVGIADSMHVVDHYLELCAGGAEPRKALEDAVAHTLWPCFLTSTTTAAGLGSLGISSLLPVRELGLFAAAGVLAAFVLTFTLLPVIVVWVRQPLRKHAAKGTGAARPREAGVVGGLLYAIASMSRRTAIIILAAAVAIAVGAGFGIARLHVGTNSMDYFKVDDPVRIEVAGVDRRIGGSASLEFMVEGPPGLAKDPVAMRAVDDLERYLGSIGAVTGVYSIVGPMKEMNRVMWGEPEAYAIPEEASLLAKYLVLLEGTDDFDSAVTEDYSVLRVTARVRMEASEELSHRLEEIEAYLATSFPTNIHAVPTGLVKLMNKSEEYLLETQVRSFSLAFVIIFAFMVLLLGSARLGVLAMIPNFLPVVIIVGAMGMLGIPLDVSTVMIASIAIGLVVDDTIHLLTRLRRELERSDGSAESTQEALRRTLVGTGRAVMATSIVLTAGFLVLTSASFRPNILFGALSAGTVVAALLADVLVLPAVIIALRLDLRPARLRGATGTTEVKEGAGVDG